MDIIIKKISSNKLIDDACAILYKEYIAIGGWNFTPNNPSQIKVICKGKRKLLVDRITNHATWFGAFVDNKLVGCIRLFKATNDLPFEIETYPAAQKITEQYIIPNKPLLYECTRACIASKYRGMNILNLLYQACLEHCQAKRSAVFGTTTNSYIKALLKKIDWPLKQEQAFKFEKIETTPVNFYLSSYHNGEISNSISKLKALNRISPKIKQENILEALNIVAPILPVPVYWHDTTGKVLGLNELCIKGMGAPTSDYVIGKTPYDFYPKETAEHILNHNEIVMRTGEVSFQEESIHDITTGVFRTYLAVKSPLYSAIGNIIGIIGTSVEITAEKEAEKLRAEIAKKAASEAQQQKFQVFFDKLLKNITPLIQLINSFKFMVLNDQLGKVTTTIANNFNQQLQLTKRELEVLYYLSLNKSPKEIASILTIIYNKEISTKSIQAIIDKQLYPKFDTYNIGQLIEKAHLYKLLPVFLI